MQQRAWVMAGVAALLIGIVALVGIVALNRQAPTVFPEGTPAGAVQRFLQALDAQDYQRAFDLLTKDDTQDKTRNYDDFRRMAGSGRERSSVQIVFDGETIKGDTADVFVVYSLVNRGPTLPFSNPVSRQRVRFLLEYQGDRWLIREFPFELVYRF